GNTEGEGARKPCGIHQCRTVASGARGRAGLPGGPIDRVDVSTNLKTSNARIQDIADEDRSVLRHCNCVWAAEHGGCGRPAVSREARKTGMSGTVIADAPCGAGDRVDDAVGGHTPDAIIAGVRYENRAVRSESHSVGIAQLGARRRTTVASESTLELLAH